MNFSNLGGMAASDCDDVMVVGPEAGNDFEDSIIAVSLFQKKRMNATTPEQVASAPKKILQYCQVDGKRWPNLQKLAMKVYSMAASSASAERNFSTFGFVHSKLRNQLDPETVKKLVFIKSNSSQFEDHLFHDVVQDSSDTDDDKE